MGDTPEKNEIPRGSCMCCGTLGEFISWHDPASPHITGICKTCRDKSHELRTLAEALLLSLEDDEAETWISERTSNLMADLGEALRNQIKEKERR